MSELVIVAIITTLGSILASSLVFILAWRKIKPEERKIIAESTSSLAEASESWAQSNKLAVEQIIQFQLVLAKERELRIDSDRKLQDTNEKLKDAELKIAQLDAKICSIESAHDKETQNHKQEMATINSRVSRLEEQVRGLGQEPVQ